MTPKWNKLQLNCDHLPENEHRRSVLLHQGSERSVLPEGIRGAEYVFEQVMEHSDPLFQFFGGYFNQDWDADARDWQGIVKLYQRDVSRSDQLALASLIRSRMIESPLSDEDLDRALFQEYGCYYSSQGDGISPREWLEELVNFLEKD